MARALSTTKTAALIAAAHSLRDFIAAETQRMDDPHGDGTGNDAVPPDGDDWNTLREAAQRVTDLLGNTQPTGLRIPRPGDLLRTTGLVITGLRQDEDEPLALPAGSLVVVLSRTLYDHAQGFQLELAGWDERTKEPNTAPFYLDEADEEDGALAVRWP